MSRSDLGAVVAVGSVHVDLIASTARLPGPGECVLGERFEVHPGGKAGNQATQAARCGIPAHLIGRVGNDPFGKLLRERLAAGGVNLAYLANDPGAATGACPVFTAADGVYATVIVPGASRRLTTAEIDAAANIIAIGSVLLLQFEIDPAISAHAADLARSHGARVLLNASPAPPTLTDGMVNLLRLADIVVVNRSEAQALTGQPIAGVDGAFRAAEALRTRFGLQSAVVTIGPDGAVARTPDGRRHIAGHRVEVVETIGAGDAFTGALAAELARGASVAEAFPLANAAGALAVTKRGAFDALPGMGEIRGLLSRRRADLTPSPARGRGVGG